MSADTTDGHGAGRRRRTRAEQQAETRARLIEAAAEVFASHGFEGASIDLITERAGYSRGAFYSNFSDKAELLLELSAVRMGDFARVLPDILAASDEDRIGEAARWLTDQPPHTEVLLLVELARLRDEHTDAQQLLARLTDSTLGFVDDVLDEADETLATPAAHDRLRLTRAILAAITGAQLLRHLGVEMDARTMELLLAGVLRSPVLTEETVS
ncbi:TetR/AcrR family transcriptional regulator [Egicoccus halophilus]|uniref:HTH tetR-type domain-containing protein n=1 Tax=Egicoccus halophilus TaxID=1670830 RepID=A0A8J3AB53_9ACTN|nr:TetR/AcrR family transcriptional regulator [Egicoccus halophilus]GGI07067.1 hypothetical protein GCM10011354_22240 [Egicoccus halophilus]